MRNRTKQREARKQNGKKPREEYISYFNHERYSDPVACIDFTPKGTNDRQEVGVYAKNRLDASNYLILNQIWGKQHSVRISTAALLK